MLQSEHIIFNPQTRLAERRVLKVKDTISGEPLLNVDGTPNNVVGPAPTINRCAEYRLSSTTLNLQENDAQLCLPDAVGNFCDERTSGTADCFSLGSGRKTVTSRSTRNPSGDCLPDPSSIIAVA